MNQNVYDDLDRLRHKLVNQTQALKLYQRNLSKIAQSLEKDLEVINEIVSDLEKDEGG